MNPFDLSIRIRAFIEGTPNVISPARKSSAGKKLLFIFAKKKVTCTIFVTVYQEPPILTPTRESTAKEFYKILSYFVIAVEFYEAMICSWFVHQGLESIELDMPYSAEESNLIVSTLLL